MPNAWRPIATLDRTKMQFVLVHEDGMQRTMLWNPRGYWEHPHPFGTIASFNPDFFMELPESPKSAEIPAEMESK